MKTNDIGVLFGMLLLMGLISFLMGVDHGEESGEQIMYCKMVSIWKSESHLSPEQRAGWPDYKGNYNEACK